MLNDAIENKTCSMCEDESVGTVLVNLEDGQGDYVLYVCAWHRGD